MFRIKKAVLGGQVGPAVELEVGGSGYVYELIGMLANSGHSDIKQLAQEVAEKTGVRLHDELYGINQQIIDTRAREHMRDHQLSEFQSRVKNLWEAAEQHDSRGYRLIRSELNDWLHRLTYEDHVTPIGCDTIRNVHLVVLDKAGCQCGQLIRRR